MTSGSFARRRLEVPSVGVVRNVQTPQREFMALIEAPGCVTVRTDRGLVAGQPLGRRLSVYYAFSSQDQMTANFVSLFREMLDKAREAASFEQVFLTFEDNPNRPWAEPLFAEAGFELEQEWVRMALVDPSSWRAQPDLPADLAIRDATPADVETIAGLDAACFGEGAWGAEGQATLLRGMAWTAIAEVEGRPAGYIQLRRTPDNVGEIFELAVHPDVRGRRYGSQMLERSLAWLVDAGVRRVEVTVSTGEPEALDLMRRYGFVAQRSGLTYRRPADESLIQQAVQEAVKRSFIVKFGDWR